MTWPHMDTRGFERGFPTVKQAMRAVEALEANDIMHNSYIPDARATPSVQEVMDDIDRTWKTLPHATPVASATDKLLQERGKVHGNWKRQAEVAVGIRNLFYATSPLPPYQSEALTMIAVKISRILCGDPNHRDHWDDIAGYARLVSQELERGNG